MVFRKTTLVGFVFVLGLILALGCETGDCLDDGYNTDDPREGKAYYTVRIVDQTPIDQLSSATPGADIDAVALIKSGTFDEIYADMALDNELGPFWPFPGLENPDLATGEPAWPDGDCLADHVEFYGMGGHDGHLVLRFGNQEIEQGDTLRVYECANGPWIEHYRIAVGASGNGVDFSFVGIGYNDSGIVDFTVPELPALPLPEAD
jgi:hypothetical protein